MTHQEAMKDPCVTFFTQRILEMSEDKDVVDRYNSVQLAADILKAEMNENLAQDPVDMVEII